MHLLQDIITYVRRIIKTPSNAQISDDLIIDYINRFWITDVDARMQLFDLKKKYQFLTQPGVDRYNMPLYSVQTEPDGQLIGSYPVYQGFLGPAYVNGVQVPFNTQRDKFFNIWPNVTQSPIVLGVGDGSAGPYSFTLPILPGNSSPVNPPVNAILRGHVDISGIIASGSNVDPILGTTLDTSIPVTSVDSSFYITSTDTTGANVVVQDSGQFLTGNVNLGLLMAPGAAPLGNSALTNDYFSSFVITGATQANPCVLTATTNFQIGQSVQISGVNGMIELNGNTYTVLANGGATLTIDVDASGFTAYVSGGTVSSLSNVVNYLTGEVTNLFFQSGLPRSILFYNNTLTLRSPPDQIYRVELDAYLSPAAFLVTSEAIPFGYMAEYIARGAARKILSDTGDVEQFMFYEPLFREQELLVWKRSQRQWTATRTETIYSQGSNQGQSGYNNFGAGNF